MEMFKEAETSVKLVGEMSELFKVEVGVYQDSVLSPLLFVILMDALTHDLETTMEEFLYAEDLVLLGDSWKEVEETFVRWKSALERFEGQH